MSKIVSKKILSLFILLVFILAFSTSSLSKVSAGSNLSVELKSSVTNVPAGDVFEITATLPNSPQNVTGLQIEVEFDSELFSYVEDSVVTLTSGNNGDLVSADFNPLTNKIVFQYLAYDGSLPANTNDLFKFSLMGSASVMNFTTGNISISKFINGNDKVDVNTAISVGVIPLDNVTAKASSSASVVQPGEEFMITVDLLGYTTSEIHALQVDVEIDTEIVDFVSGSIVTYATPASSNDFMGTKYNQTNSRVIFQYTPQTAGTVFPNSIKTLFTFKVRAKDNITNLKRAVFNIKQFALVMIENGKQVNKLIDINSGVIVSVVPASSTTPTITITPESSSIPSGGETKVIVSILPYKVVPAQNIIFTLNIDTEVLDIMGTAALIDKTLGTPIVSYDISQGTVTFMFSAIANGAISNDLFSFTVKAKNNITDETRTTVYVSKFLTNSINVDLNSYAYIDIYSEKTESYIGDIDANLKVDVEDLNLLIQALHEKKTLTNTQKIAADLDKDSELTAKDIAILRRILLK